MARGRHSVDAWNSKAGFLLLKIWRGPKCPTLANWLNKHGTISCTGERNQRQIWPDLGFQYKQPLLAPFVRIYEGPRIPPSRSACIYVRPGASPLSSWHSSLERMPMPALLQECYRLSLARCHSSFVPPPTSSKKPSLISFPLLLTDEAVEAPRM